MTVAFLFIVRVDDCHDRLALSESEAKILLLLRIMCIFAHKSLEL